MESVDGTTLEKCLINALPKHVLRAAGPGAIFDGQVTVWSLGIARLQWGPPVTNDVLFSVALISKVWTVMLVIQLVGKGLGDLDAAGNRCSDPPFRLSDRDVADSVTMHHLLWPRSTGFPAWTSGWAISYVESPRPRSTPWTAASVAEHTGNSCGYDSTHAVVPEGGLAVCVLPNGDLAGILRNDLASQVLAGAPRIGRPAPPGDGPLELTPDPAPILGTYEGLPDDRIRVEQGSDGFDLAVDPSDGTGLWANGFTSPPRHMSDWTYLNGMPLLAYDVVAPFLFESGDDDTGVASHLASGLRISQRVNG